MVYVNFGGIRDPLRQNLALQFCINRNKDVSILTETHVNLDQIHHIKNYWLGAILFSPGDSQTKRLRVLLYLGIEGVTEVDTDPKRRFMSFNPNMLEGKRWGEGVKLTPPLFFEKYIFYREGRTLSFFYF